MEKTSPEEQAILPYLDQLKLQYNISSEPKLFQFCDYIYMQTLEIHYDY